MSEIPAIKSHATRKEAEVWVRLGEANGLLRAADLVSGWDISKGGYGHMAFILREMAAADGVDVRECKTILEEPGI
jgi:hypothetical protein